MTVRQIAELLGARVFTAGGSANVQISRAFAGNHVSELLGAASAETLLVSSLSGAQLLRLAELMDVPAICLVGGTEVSAELVYAARGRGVALLVSPRGLEATARLFTGQLEVVGVG